MRHTKRALAALAVFAALSAAAVGCGGAADADPSPTAVRSSPSGVADITGTVVRLDPGGDGSGLTLLVVADAGVPSAVDRASVRVGAETIVWAAAGDARRELTMGDLEKGQEVAVWFAGPVAESYPVQASAGAVAVLSPLR